MRVLFVIFLSLLLSGCNESEVNALKERNQDLRDEITSLKEQIELLQQTADFHFKQGKDYIKQKKFDAAIDSFNTVIEKYPNDLLVASAKIAVEEASKARDEQIAKEVEVKRAEAMAHEKETAKSGEATSYENFYAKSKTGLNIGKRYRFDACLSSAGDCIYSISENMGQMICGIEPEFDDPSEYEAALRGGTKYCSTIVASMRYGGIIGIHRLH